MDGRDSGIIICWPENEWLPTNAPRSESSVAHMHCIESQDSHFCTSAYKQRLALKQLSLQYPYNILQLAQKFKGPFS